MIQTVFEISKIQVLERANNRVNINSLICSTLAIADKYLPLLYKKEKIAAVQLEDNNKLYQNKVIDMISTHYGY